MPNPGVFGGIGGAARDILTKNYAYDKKIEIKSQTADGVSFGASSSALASGAIAGDFNLKTKTGIAALTGKVDTNGKLSVSADISDAFTKGLKVVFTGLYPDPAATAAAEYRADIFTLTSTINNKLNLTGSAAVSLGDGAVAGGLVEYDTNKGVPTKYDIGIAYSKPEYSIAGIVRKKLTEVVVSYVHHLNSGYSVAGEFVHNNESASNVFTLGGIYKLDKSSSVKAKLDTEGVASAAYSQELRPKVTLVLSAQVNTKTLDKESHKLGLALLVDA